MGLGLAETTFLLLAALLSYLLTGVDGVITAAFSKMALTQPSLALEVVHSGAMSTSHCAILCKINNDDGGYCNAAAFDGSDGTCKLSVMAEGRVSPDLTLGEEALVFEGGLVLGSGLSHL